MTRPRYFVVTDIEGVAGIDSFARTRTADEDRKAPAMDQLAREVAACVRGIRSVRPDARVDVWDGHGSGGLRESDVRDARYLDDGTPYFDIEGYEAVLFVGQHAMAGTVDAPLAHTYSSREVAYYRLNRTFVGEFGARAFVAGSQGVPTVYLSGDDKAALEAEQFVPNVTTTAVKFGEGREAARHVASEDACEMIREDVARGPSRRPRRPVRRLRPALRTRNQVRRADLDRIGARPMGRRRRRARRPADGAPRERRGGRPPAVIPVHGAGTPASDRGRARACRPKSDYGPPSRR